MESIRRKMFDGTISEAEYRKNAIASTVDILNNNNFNCIENLGYGSFGIVVGLQHPVHPKMAAKIVLREYVSESELELWPRLKHDNILPLIKVGFVPSAYTCLFLMPKHQALDVLVEDRMFYTDINAFDRAVSWLKGIAKGVEYLHGEKLCHLDLKLCNVLITEEDKSVICDFGSLTRTERATKNYASPFIYRAPEAFIAKDGTKAVVDGFKYDIFTLGILTMELFTKQSVYKSPEWPDTDPTWADVMYSRIFDILKKKQFEKLVRSTFFMADIDSKTIKSIRNFIQSCICLNPRHRPSIPELLEHQVFGGQKQFPTRVNDVWHKRVSPEKIEFLVSLFIGQATALSSQSVSSEVKASEDVPEIESGVGDNEKQVKMNSSKDSVPEERKPEPLKLSRKQKILQWAARKKSNLRNTMNRLLNRLRK